MVLAGSFSRRSALSLVELLVVTAIIGLLLAVAAPTFSHSRQKALQIRCLANIAELNRGMLLYAASNHWLLPRTRLEVRGADPVIWTALIYPVLRRSEVFLCPAARDARFTTEWADRGWLSVGLNRKLDLPPAPQVDSIAQPARVILLADSVYGPTDPPQMCRGFMIGPTKKANQREGIADRHRGRTDIGFVDGHVDHYVGGDVHNEKRVKEAKLPLLWQP
jgi:prepilin-type processing-associated H-X9-DG protein/prepilin-type N-terminal cleavage/methylation domain-containing protein